MQLSITMPAILRAQPLSLKEQYETLHRIGCRLASILLPENAGEDKLFLEYEAATNAGLRVSSLRIQGNPFDSEEAYEYIRRSVIFSQKLPIDTLIVPLGTEKNMAHYPYLDRNEDYLKSLLPFVEKNGSSLLFDNAGSFMEPHYARFAREIRLLTDRVPHPLLGVNFNVGNAGLAMMMPCDQIRLLGNLIKAVDFSDNFGAFDCAVYPERQDMHLVPLSGYIDYDQVMQGLTDVGFNGVVNLSPNMPRARDCFYPSTGRVKFSVSAASGLTAWALHVGQSILEAYDVLEEKEGEGLL